METLYKIGSILGILTFLSILIQILRQKLQRKVREAVAGKIVYTAIIFFGILLVILGLEHILKNFSIVENIKDYMLFMGVFTIIFSITFKYFNDLKDFFRNENDSIRKFKKDITHKLEKFEIADENIFYHKIFELDFSELNYFDKLFLDKQYHLSKKNCLKSDKDYFVQGMYHLRKYKADYQRKEKTRPNQKKAIKRKEKALSDTLQLFDETLEHANTAERPSVYRAEYFNYKGVSHDAGEEYLNAIECFLRSIKEEPYEKPFYNMACSLASIIKDVTNGKQFREFYDDVIFSQIKKAIKKREPKKLKSIDVDIDFKITDMSTFLNTCFKKSLLLLCISIELEPKNFFAAHSTHEKNELRILDNDCEHCFLDEKEKGLFKTLMNLYKDDLPLPPYDIGTI